MNTIAKNRIESIDILRGIVMIIMALDHVRDYFYYSPVTDDPMNFATTTPFLFFTRWITHFCAPVFIFLSGTSIYLQSLRKTKKELGLFLITRGLWLIFLEIVVNSFGWSFNPHYNAFFFQVIWAIGISMVLMGFLIHLPYKIILALGLIIVLGHNLLDIPESRPGFNPGFMWNLLHHGAFARYEVVPGHSILIVYPFIPWTGLMIMGFCLGKLYDADVLPAERRKNLNIAGTLLIVLFFILRYTNAYGDPQPWEIQKNTLFTFFSMIDVHKYPPSLLYMFMTIGPALLVLSGIETVQNKVTGFIKVFGRVALFYYILHIYLIHTLCMIVFFIRGHSIEEGTHPKGHFPFYFHDSKEGFSLLVVYLIWALIIGILYPICKAYDKYKTNHKEKKWLSYL